MRSRFDLPVMLGTHLRKGLFAARNSKMGGFDLLIVWLKEKHQTGESYDVEDIEKADVCLHFCDRKSIVQTISILTWMLEQWKED